MHESAQTNIKDSQASEPMSSEKIVPAEENREKKTIEETKSDPPSAPTSHRFTTGAFGDFASALLRTPKNCRHDQESPPGRWTLNVLFPIATGITIANLYYNQPILYQIADSFHVSFQKASSIATLMQGGYCGGMLLICPLGDVFPRRPFILLLVALTAIMWLGLCLTSSFEVFSALSFICGFTTVTPQLVFPLVGDVAPSHRRATCLSLVVSGMYLGILLGRVLSGIIANYTPWRNIYWFAFALQWTLFILLFCFMPNYPSKNPGGFNYLSVLVDIGRLAFSTPLLMQACITTFSMMAVFTSYWSTLSFLLSSPPYSYSSAVIGLFGLISILIICAGPIYTRYVINKMNPLVTVLISLAVELAGVAFGTFTGDFTVAGPVVQALVIDFANLSSNIAQRGAIYAVNPKASSRMNTAYMVAGVGGQFAGTAAGNKLYALGGWRTSGVLSIGLICFSIGVTAARGPRETRWIGWQGGWTAWRDDLSQEEQVASSPERDAEEARKPPGTRNNVAT